MKIQNIAPQMLYIMQNGNTNQYKIGITNNLNRRFKQLQTGCPGELKIIKIWTHTQREFIKKYELILHNYYTEKGQKIRPNGEWFTLTKEQVKELCKPNGTKEQNQLVKKFLENF
jgi:predicted GIY-YIG superfamily endonuclease